MNDAIILYTMSYSVCFNERTFMNVHVVNKQIKIMRLGIFLIKKSYLRVPIKNSITTEVNIFKINFFSKIR